MPRQHVVWRAHPNERVIIDGLWIAECHDCGEFRFAWGRGLVNHWFRLNPQNHSCHQNQWWDHAPVTWFCSPIILGTLGSPQGTSWP